eukprot:TRINITY_DN8312_c0_g1_i1.p2 TRINITY_DN8312_c0_g1~~TRINITY_DN8312_c0_g1_i1.p2  ORF type:complete len:180 (+),score=37.49 TRINITY_DN8312_c0_g1_i1:943-1482(+)
MANIHTLNGRLTSGVPTVPPVGSLAEKNAMKAARLHTNTSRKAVGDKPSSPIAPGPRPLRKPAIPTAADLMKIEVDKKPTPAPKRAAPTSSRPAWNSASASPDTKRPTVARPKPVLKGTTVRGTGKCGTTLQEPGRSYCNTVSKEKGFGRVGAKVGKKGREAAVLAFEARQKAEAASSS